MSPTLNSATMSSAGYGELCFDLVLWLKLQKRGTKRAAWVYAEGKRHRSEARMPCENLILYFRQK